MFPLKKRKIVDYIRRKSWRKALPKYMSKKTFSFPYNCMQQCYNFCNVQCNTVACEYIAS